MQRNVVQEPVVKFSRMVKASWQHVDTLKSAMVGIFVPEKSANTAHQHSFCYWQNTRWSVNGGSPSLCLTIWC